MEQELIRVDRRYRLACSKKKSISACSAIMYQKLEQYAKLVCRIFCSILKLNLYTSLSQELPMFG